MEKKPTAPANKPRAPYQKPVLKSYGSIQSITLAKAVKSVVMDGPGGGGKTSV